MEEGPGRPEEFFTVYVSLLEKLLISFKCAAIKKLRNLSTIFKTSCPTPGHITKAYKSTHHRESWAPCFHCCSLYSSQQMGPAEMSINR